MKYAYVDSLKINNQKYFFLRETENMKIILDSSRYLKHKIMEQCSPNTVKRIAYAISYYLNFLDEQKMTTDGVLKLRYSEQYEHFEKFLYWIKEGNHCNREKKPNNNTCNSYLESVFGYYQFLILEYEKEEKIKVLESRGFLYSGAGGVKFEKNIMVFRGYLPHVESYGKTTNEDSIQKILDACTCLRNQLLILILAETGIRIGEALGIRYTEDIDFQKHIISVRYRQDNENEARAKNAEQRKVLISNETFQILLYYLSENRELFKKTEYLFVTSFGKTEGKPLTVNAVYSMLRQLEKHTNIKITPHMLRHYFANERRKSGWRLEKISFALGHKHIATTEKYMNIENNEMEEVMSQYYQENQGLYDISKLI